MASRGHLARPAAGSWRRLLVLVDSREKAIAAGDDVLLEQTAGKLRTALAQRLEDGAMLVVRDVHAAARAQATQAKQPQLLAERGVERGKTLVAAHHEDLPVKRQ